MTGSLSAGGGAVGSGAGLNLSGAGELRILNCTFSSNATTARGGAIFSSVANTMIISNCTFVANTSTGNNDGGGVIRYTTGATTSTFWNCSFVSNAVINKGSGGVIAGGVQGALSFYNCVFRGNFSPANGGAIHTLTRVNATECDFIDNVCTNGTGGAINRVSGGTVGMNAFVNCSFLGNRAADGATGGGGAVCENATGSSHSYLNCTFLNNTNDHAGTGSSGGAMRFVASTALTITNSIFRNNWAKGPGDNITLVGTLDLAYSDIDTSSAYLSGGTWTFGSGIVTNNPRFVSETAPLDAHLQSVYGRWETATGRWTNDAVQSPDIDAGDPANDHALEPYRPGSAIELGRYGNTREASWADAALVNGTVIATNSPDTRVTATLFADGSAHNTFIYWKRTATPPSPINVPGSWDGNAAGSPGNDLTNSITNTISGALMATPGNYFVTIRATNATADIWATNLLTFTVSGAVLPSAGDDSAATLVNVPLTLHVTTNDTDFGVPIASVGPATWSGSTVSVADSTNILYTPAANSNGTDSFPYVITNAYGSATGTVTVTVSIPPLAAGDDAAATTVDAPVTISVTTNDAYFAAPIASIAQPTWPGSTAAIANGTSILYTPAASSNGTDQFQYVITNAFGQSATGLVTVTVSIPVLVASNDTATTMVNVPLTLNVTANDAYFAAPIASVSAAAWAGSTVSVTNGTSVYYTPAANSNGTDSFTYTITNAAGDSATGTVTVTVNAVSAKTWDGEGADDQWSTGLNWDSDGFPAFPVALTFAGTNRLTPLNDFSGKVVGTNSGNAIVFAADAGSFVLGGNAVTLAGNITNSSSTNQAITLDMDLGSSARTLTPGAGLTLTLGGTLSDGAGGLVAGPGTLVLNGANTYSGATVNAGGTLAVGNDGALGSGALVLSNGVFRAADATERILANNLVLAGNATLGWTNTGALTFNGAWGDLGTTVRTLTISNTVTINNVLTNTAGLTTAGSGTLVLNGANTFSGLLYMGGSCWLAVGNDQAIGAATLQLQGGSLRAADFNDRVLTNNVNSPSDTTIGAAGTGNLTFQGSILNLGTSRRTKTIANTVTIYNAITGTVGFAKAGTGTLVLYGTNNFGAANSTITVSAGTLALGTDSALGLAAISPLVFGSGAILRSADGNSRIVSNTLSITGDPILGSPDTGALTFNGATADLGTGTRTFTISNALTTINCALTNTAALTKTGAGVLVLGGVNTYGGATVISQGTLRMGGAAALPAGSALTNNATLDLGGFNLALTTLGGVNASALITSSAGGDVVLTVNAGSYAGAITNGAGAVWLFKDSAGALILSNQCFHTGLTVINAGQLVAAHGAALQGSTVSNLVVGGLVFRGGTTFTLGGLAGTGDVALTNQAGSPVTLVLGNNDSDATYAGVLSGPGNLVKVGGGIQTLSSTNLYTGSTIVSNGTLSLSSGFLCATNDVLLAAPGRLDLNFAGTNVVGNVWVEGVLQGPGVYTSNSLPAYITGPGTLRVTGSDQIRVETAPGGGAVVSTSLVAGAQTTVYAIRRDPFGAFVANVTADSWYLTNVTGGIVSGDLAASGASAVFTARAVGSATLIAVSTGLPFDVSASVTVVAGPAAQLRVETLASGAGVVVPAQTNITGATVPAYAVLRDAFTNYLGNVAATWGVTNVTGSVTAGDLVAATGNSNALFTAHSPGSALIAAVSLDGAFTNLSGRLTVAAANTYWDGSSANGIQGGDGLWSAAHTNWGTNRVSSALIGWADGNTAQFVVPSNGVASVVTLSGTVSPASVQVSGGPYTVVVTNGGQILNGSAASTIGTGATGAVAIVTGSGSLWDLGSNSLYIGNGQGSVSNQLVVAQGGTLRNVGLYLGGQSGGAMGSRALVDGGTVALLGNQSLSIGEQASACAMILTNGAVVRRAYDATGGATVLGNNNMANSNVLVIAPNCVWDNGNGYLYVGAAIGASYNRVTLDGGSMTNIGGNQRVNVGSGNNASRNSLIVTNGGLLQWGASRSLYLGYGTNTSCNTFELAAGGVAVGAGSTIYIGAGASAWSNTMIVGCGGTVTNISTVALGSGAGAMNNTLIMDGGTLYAGKITVDTPGNAVDFRGGLMSLSGASSHSIGQPLVVGDGTQAAVLNAGSAFAVPFGIVVTNNAVLAGACAISATAGTTIVYGSLLPGGYSNATGVLLHNGAVTLMPGALLQIDIASTNATPGTGWDRLVVTNGALTLGGTLKPVLLNGFLPASTNSFPYVVSNSVALAGAFDGSQTNGARVTAYSNDQATVVGTFRLGISNSTVVLDDFQAGVAAAGDDQVWVETAVNGGSVVSTTMVANASFTVYAVRRSTLGTYVGNVAADTWALTNVTGGVADGDLVVAGDRKSATFTGHGTGTVTIVAEVSGVAQDESATVTVNAGPAIRVAVETAADGSGLPFPATNLTAGGVFTVYAVTRDSCTNFVANVTPDTWLLANKTGSVADGDLAAAGASATFNARGEGTAAIRAVVASLQTNDSGTVTVGAGAAVSIRVETAADGNGTVVPVQGLAQGSALTVYAIQRDAYTNFVANVTPDTWALVDKSGGTVDGDLADNGANATFTANAVGGKATIRATQAGLASTDSGELTVASGVDKIWVETAAAGGTVVSTNVAAGTSFTAYAIRRNALGGFIGNVAADAWVLTNVTGGVVSGDLVVGASGSNAVFTAHAPGTATLVAICTGLAADASASVTGVVGPAAFLQVETAANGSGTVVPSQTNTAGAAITAYAVLRDACTNYVGNTAATWALTNTTGAVTAEDLAAASGGSNATFTCRGAGSASLLAVASAGGLSGVSGVLTVNPTNFYWDTAVAFGLQGGDGVWSAAAANWSTNRSSSAALGWAGGNHAVFAMPSNGLPSTVTLTGSVSAASVQVSGAPYTLIVTNGGQIAGGVANSFIGNGTTGNTVTVTGPGSAWDLGGMRLSVGTGAGGVSNSLTISQGAAVTNLALFLGDVASSSLGNRVLIDNAVLIVKSNQAVSVGERGSDNALLLANGAVLRRDGQTNTSATSTTALGNNGGAHNNLVLIATNCVWDNGFSGSLLVGSGSGVTNNRVVIDGGAMTNIGSNSRLSIGTGNNSAWNAVIVTNGGLLQWVNSRRLYIGEGTNASYNALNVSAGGCVVGAGNAGYVGYGIGAWSNTLVVGRGATVTNFLALYVGNGVAATNNSLVMDGGTFYVSELYADYPGNAVDFRGGWLCLKTSGSHRNGLPLVVGDGTQAAVLEAQGACAVPLGIVVTNNATLAGTGSYDVAPGTSTVYGTVNPGRLGSIAGLLHNGAVTLEPGSVVRVDIASTNRTSGYDRFTVTNGTLTLGGTLKPVLLNGFMPEGSDSFPYVVSNSMAFGGAFDGGKVDGSRIKAYSTNLTTVLGTFRLGISSNGVVLDGFIVAGSGTVFKFQ